jgi:hypothetical protein
MKFNITISLPYQICWHAVSHEGISADVIIKDVAALDSTADDVMRVGRRIYASLTWHAFNDATDS